MSNEEKKLVKEIMDSINRALKIDKDKARTPGGIEVDTPPEWCEVIEREGRIIHAYEKVGWRVVWYREEYAVKPTRRWLAFRPSDYKTKR